MSATKVEELEQRREERREALRQKRDEQLVKDLEAAEKLEEEHGFVAGVSVTRFVEGHAARAFVKAPEPAQYKRYRDNVGKGVQKENAKHVREAQDELANACWVYPLTPEERNAMAEEHAGIRTQIALAAIRLAEGRQVEEGKD